MPVSRRVRAFLSRTDPSDDTSDRGTAKPVPATSPPLQEPVRTTATVDAAPLSNGRVTAGDLPVADGQELLGPCRVCGGYWTRLLLRGQKPFTCPVCKAAS